MKDDDYERMKDRLLERLWEVFPPLEEEVEKNDWIPKEIIVPVLQELGAFGLLVPEEYGGSGLRPEQYIPILVGLSRIHGGLRGFVHAHNSSAHMFDMIASEEQKRDLLPLVARGERSFAFGLTEPDAGTGADSKTRAVRDGDVYVVNGEKHLTTNSDWASHIILFVKTGEGKGPHDVSALLVDKEQSAEGLDIQPLPETMGTRGLQHGHLTFTDMRVPVANLLGGEGDGLAFMEHGLEDSRLYVAASSLGTAEEALKLSLRRAQGRVTFGKPIASRQSVQRYLAEMATDVYALRTMIEDATRRLSAGERIPGEASMCKLFGLEAVCRVTDRALLVFGGIGYTRKYPIERMLRDARANVVEEGPPTVQYLVIARALLEREASEVDARTAV